MSRLGKVSIYVLNIMLGKGQQIRIEEWSIKCTEKHNL